MDDQDDTVSDQTQSPTAGADSATQNIADDSATPSDTQTVVSDQPTDDTPAQDDSVLAEDQTQSVEHTEVEAPAEEDSTQPVVAEDSEVVSDEEESAVEPEVSHDDGQTVQADNSIPNAESEADEAPQKASGDNEEAEIEDSTSGDTQTAEDAQAMLDDSSNDDPRAKWYVVHTYSGHENKVAAGLKQRIESEHLDDKILDVLVPTQEKIEIRGGKKASVKEKIFPGYILVKMILDDNSWLAVRTTQGVTSFVGMGNKPTPIPEAEVKTIVRFMTQGAAPTFKDVYMVDDTVKITDGPFAEFIGKVDSVDKEHGKVRVLVSIFGRETPVELDFLQVQKL